MSFLRRVWRAITRPTGFVGRDLEGNSFYERLGHNSSARTRRIVKYRKPEDQWLYIGGQRRLAVQWSAWLSHTRSEPPTLQELQLDVLRQQRLQHNVQLIQAREEAERREQQMLSQSRPAEAVAAPQSEPDPATGVNVAQPEPRPAAEPRRQPGQLSSSPSTSKEVAKEKPAFKALPTIGSDEYKPESWSPRASVQRGG